MISDLKPFILGKKGRYESAHIFVTFFLVLRRSEIKSSVVRQKQKRNEKSVRFQTSIYEYILSP